MPDSSQDPFSGTPDRDPLHVVWDALGRARCWPHGQPHNFRAYCPVHDGDNPEGLHVAVGADGRALLHCFAHGCRVGEITGAIGLGLADLFPAGHRSARRRDLPNVRRGDLEGNVRVVVNVLAAVDARGREWYLELRFDCPCCGSPAALLQASPKFAVLSCPGDPESEDLGSVGCTLRTCEAALAAELEGREAA